MTRMAFMALLLTGCEAFIPNGNGKPRPAPTPVITPTSEPQRIEIVVRYEGEGRISVSGDGSINVKTANNSAEPNGCQCGCGKSGCQCTRDLGGVAHVGQSHAMTGTAEVVLSEQVKKSRDLIVISPASFRCQACELAVSSLRALGMDVEQKKVDGRSQYPVIQNRKGEEYLIPDGYWRVGRDDVEAVKRLAK